MRSLKRQRGFLNVGAIVGSALLGGAGSIISSQQQANAANTASSINQQEFQQINQQLQPFIQAGQPSLQQLTQGLQPGGQFNHMFGLQDFQQSPAYQFNLQQGQMALDKAANARGGGNLYAPQTLQDLSRFSQGLASNEFQNAFNNYQTGTNNIYNRLYNASAASQNAAAQLGGFGTTTAGNLGNIAQNVGDARAAGTIGVANAGAGAINSLANLSLINRFLALNQAPTTDLTGQGIG